MKIKKKIKFLTAYMLIITLFSTYVVLDTFVITRVYGDADQNTEEYSQDEGTQEDASEENSAEAEETPEASQNSESRGPGSGKGKGGHGPGSHSGNGHKPGSRSNSDSSEESDSSDDSDSSELSSPDSSESSSGSAAAVASDSYSDENISITLKEYRENDTTVYVADVQVSDPKYLQTALAQGVYGRNVTETTSEIASGVNAILAINGDFYGARQAGYVIRNGTLYRKTAIKNRMDLVIYDDGSFGIINEADITAEELIADGAVQTLSFGPALIQNGSVSVTESQEVGRAMASNPRTAIGIIDECHYVFVVSDGRTDESEGLSLNELAEFMDSLGVETAYNLDGGGSSTMYFNGQVVNNPTTGGNTIKERSVSDIVYIGY